MKSLAAIMCVLFMTALPSARIGAAEKNDTSDAGSIVEEIKPESKGDESDTIMGQVIQGRAFRIKNVMGQRVLNPDAEVIGTIDDLVVGKDGRIKYAILEHGGFLGIGDKLVPIPWDAVKSLEDRPELLVNVSAISLEKAPNIDPAKWPDISVPQWDKEIREYYVLQRKSNK
jgi:sporulation protein YlmC with PRC-barrel domain